MPSTENSEAHKVLSRWWRVSLRAKGVAVLAVPMAVLFAVLFAIHWVEGDVHETELTVDRAYAIRAQMVQIHGSLVDADVARDFSLAALLQVQAGHGGAALLDLQSRGTQTLVHATSSTVTGCPITKPVAVGPCGR